MLHWIVTTPLQNVQTACDVAVNIGEEIFKAVANPRLGGQVNHHIALLSLEQLLHPLPVPEVQVVKVVEGKPGAFDTLEAAVTVASAGHLDPLPADACLTQSSELQVDIVVVIEIVQSHHLMAIRQQPLHQMKPDKSRSAGDQYLPFAHSRLFDSLLVT